MPPSPSGPDAASKLARIALAASLRRRLDEAGLSVTRVARRAEISRQALHRALSCGDVRLDTLARLAFALETTPAELLAI